MSLSPVPQDDLSDSGGGLDKNHVEANVIQPPLRADPEDTLHQV